MNKKRCIIISGVYGKLGFSLCKKIVQQGITVIGIGRNEHQLKALEQVFSEKFISVVGDVSDLSVGKNIHSISQQFQVDAMVLCSGNHREEKETFESASELIQTNMKGLFHVIYQFNLAPQTPVVVSSSIMSVLPDRKHPAYAASKAAINQFVGSYNRSPDAQLLLSAVVLGPFSKKPSSILSATTDAVADKFLSVISKKTKGIIYFPKYLSVVVFLSKIFPSIMENLLFSFRKK